MLHQSQTELDGRPIHQKWSMIAALGLPWMLPQSAMDAPSVCPGCSLSLPWMLPQTALDAPSDARAFACLPEATWVRSALDSSANRILFHGLPSNIPSFPSLYTRINGNLNLFYFTSIFTQITVRSCTGNRSNLQWKKSIANRFSCEVISGIGYCF